jgi:hypothetical protein
VSNFPSVHNHIVEMIKSAPVYDDASAYFSHVSDEDLDETSVDRAFLIDVVSGPSHIAQAVTLTPRWLVSLEVQIRYIKTRYYDYDLSRISTEVQTLTLRLLDSSLHHSSVVGVLPREEGFTNSSLTTDPDGNRIAIISFDLLYT